MGDHHSFDTSVWDFGDGDTLSINGDLSMIVCWKGLF